MKNSKKRENNLLYHLQVHERVWGTEMYPNRPELAAVLQAAVVVFWQHPEKTDRFVITLYASLDELEKTLARLLILSEGKHARGRLVRIFYQGDRMVMTGVKIRFEKAPED